MYLSAQLLDRRWSKQYPEADEKIREALRNSTGEIKRLTALLQEFRALARRPKLDLRSVSLTAIVADVLAVETLSYAPRRITVRQSFPPDLPLMRADAEKMKQVVLNLCKNASEEMAGGGELTVSADSVDGQIRLEVTDTGIGIPAGVDVFEPFVTTKAQGTGLGLTIVRQIVAAHNGVLTYRSVPGEGTTFTLTLPAAPRVEP